jgi:hypothetical protein
MKRTLALAMLVLAAACSNDQPPPQQAPTRGEGMAARPRVRAGTSSLELLPPAAWWHDEALAKAVNLTPDQLSQLDKIAATQGEDVARLERDDMIAMRDLRNAVDLQKPTPEDITTAGHRLRELRASLLDREVDLLTAERMVLDQQQWRTLQDQLAQQSRPANRSTMPRGRGMGGGRRPFPG